MTDLFVGLDAGTSTIKAVAFDLTGQTVAMAQRRNLHDVGPDGAVTQDMRRTWDDCTAVLRGLGAKVPDFADRIAAIGVTGQGDGCWIIDGAGDPVGPGWLWLDARAAGLVAGLRGGEAEAVHFRTTGTALTSCQQGPQLMWMQAHAPDLLVRAATAFHCKDWLFFRMTGVRATDPCEACFSFGDFRTRAYDDGVIDALGLGILRHLLPPILDGVRTVLPLTAAAAAETGLRTGTPVSLGYLDAVCTGLGAGILEGGQGFGCTILGSTGVHMKGMRVEDVTLPAQPTGYVMVMPIPGMVAQMQTNMAGTLNLDWMLGLAEGLLKGLDQPVPDLIERLDGWLGDANRGPLYHPYISAAGERGPFVDAHARAGFIGLTTEHRFVDLVGAVAEGLGLAARDCYSAMGGVPPEVRLTGGAARSVALRRIMAAALGVPVRPSSREEAGAAGAAMIGAVAVGAFPDIPAAVDSWVSPCLGLALEPDDAARTRQDRRFSHYLQARRTLAPLWTTMANDSERNER
ncbi:carbohydrate kinase [Pseudotabrizicola sediminis]|uniref:Carbohydrate kinase n=1 Tax=Pseudotabrizicola sediminis TaxID=2486418 RepID=A0ABY2KHL0_9RHOB|nr:FGGY-family carbohydrate kinase [Pseudotabrizicola sediminis]TGD41783.1 carbohydrate kinase [Pseudotabrizicola sediminis]